MRVYYAHSMAIYGSEQEGRDVDLLTRLGFSVVNPGLCGSSDMEFYLQMVARCDVLAFRANPDGRIPAGVFKEVQQAQRLGFPVFELPSNLLSREMSVDQTREHLREAGQR